MAVLARYGRTYFAKFDLALLTKIKNLNVQLLVQLSALIIFISKKRYKLRRVKKIKKHKGH